MTPVQSKAHALMAQLGVDHLKRLQERISEILNIERHEIDKRLESGEVTEDEHLESLHDDLIMLDEMGDTAFQLSFVGLYSLVELRLKALMRHHATSNADLERLYRIDVLRTECLARFQINLEQDVRNFSAIDEIRLINNSVKHEGLVSAQLSNKFPAWTQGQQLTELGRAFDRLAPQVPSFFEDLARRLP
jgi:hypothetical protein